MSSIRVTEGSAVKLKNDGRLGKVLSLRAEKDGSRGRPKTYAAIVLDDASEVTLPLSEFKPV